MGLRVMRRGILVALLLFVAAAPSAQARGSKLQYQNEVGFNWYNNSGTYTARMNYLGATYYRQMTPTSHWNDSEKWRYLQSVQRAKAAGKFVTVTPLFWRNRMTVDNAVAYVKGVIDYLGPTYVDGWGFVNEPNHPDQGVAGASTYERCRNAGLVANRVNAYLDQVDPTSARIAGDFAPSGASSCANAYLSVLNFHPRVLATHMYDSGSSWNGPGAFANYANVRGMLPWNNEWNPGRYASASTWTSRLQRFENAGITLTGIYEDCNPEFPSNCPWPFPSSAQTAVHNMGFN